MKKRFAVILAAVWIAAMAGCQQSDTSSPVDSSTVQSRADSGTEVSAESEHSEAESSAADETVSAQSSEEQSETSVNERSDESSRTENPQSRTEKSSKKESSTTSKKSNTSKPSSQTSKPASGGQTSTAQQQIKATGITIDKSSITLNAGSQQTLKANVNWSDGISFTTSNSNTATISGSGVITGKSAGSAVITVSYGSSKKTCNVTVKAVQPQQTPQPSQPAPTPQQQTIKMSVSSNMEVEVGKQTGTNFELFIDGSKVNNSSFGVSYSSSNTSVATVNSDGYVTGISAGTATITASYKGASASCTITVKANYNGSGSSSQQDYYTDEFGNRYSKTWIASEHERWKTQTRDGHVVYGVPEIIPLINEYRAKEGIAPLYWEDDPAQLSLTGDYNPAIDNLEYLITDINAGGQPHYNKYGGMCAMCICMHYEYNPKDWVDTLMNSPAHREKLMNPRKYHIYACTGGGGTNGWRVCIC